MTSREKNETIAVICGYWKDTENRWHRSSGAYRSVPRYTSNLNAMHEAELTLTYPQRVQYMNILLETPGCVFANAYQRVEAFLKTINDPRWK